MSKKIILTSSDGETFEVDEAVAIQCGTLKNMIEDECTGDGIPLVNVNSVTLAKVIEYLKKHVEAPGGDNDAFRSQEDAELKKWDEDFVKVDQSLLFDVILAANFLNIPGLLDLTCLTVADMMRGKTLDEIRDIFHIKNDYTELEAAAVIKENEWAFQ